MRDNSEMMTMARTARAWFDSTVLTAWRSRTRMPRFLAPASRPGRIDLARRLIADIKNHPDLVSGHNQGVAAQVIDLSVLREALGGKWHDYGHAVHRIAVRVVERHLENTDGYSRQDDRYVLTFPGSDPRAAADRARTISISLTNYLYDAAGSAVLRKPLVGRRRLHPLHEPFGWMLETVDRAVDAGLVHAHRITAAMTAQWQRAAAPRSPARACEPPHFGLVMAHAGAARADMARGSAAGDASCNSTAQRPDGHRSARRLWLVPRSSQTTLKAGDDLPQSDRAAATRASSDVEPRIIAAVASSFHATPHAHLPRPITADCAPPSCPHATPAPDAEALDAAIIAACDRLERESKRHSAAARPSGLRFFYRPMWSVRTSMMAISSCVPMTRPAVNRDADGAPSAPPDGADLSQETDLAALGHVLKDSERLAEADRTTLVSVPVHYTTIADRERRAAYAKLCKNMPAGARRRILFEVLGIGPDVDDRQLAAGVAALKPFAAMVVGQLPLDTSSFGRWKSAGLASVGVDIHDQVGGVHGGEAELIERLERFVFLASQSGLRSYVRGLSTLSLAAAAVAAGFDFVEGGIIQDQIEPSDVRTFTLEDLYLQFAGARRAPASFAC